MDSSARLAIFGSFTIKWTIAPIQSLPALIALGLLWLSPWR